MNKYLQPQRYVQHLRHKVRDWYQSKKWWTVSYSQLGEDLILKHFLPTKGFYVDVGSNHPKRFNNTYLLYQQGWRGLNIEPNPKIHASLERQRQHDTNLNIGITAKPGQMLFNIFAEDTLSTFSPEVADAYQKMGHVIAEKKIISTERLSQVLEQHRPNQQIDLLSIDTEGQDFEVLQTNDWERFRPHFILVETLEYRRDGQGKKQNQVINPYLEQHGYRQFADTYINTIFVEKEFAQQQHFFPENIL